MAPCSALGGELQDLLDPSSKRDLTIREKSSGETFVEGLSSRIVHSSVEATSILERAHADEGSNRSHAVAIAYLEQRLVEGARSEGADRLLQQSCLMLADLAASESSKRTDARYQRLDECKFINLSLSALGNCVAALAKGKAHIPYRDSKLTRLLSQSLGGNSKTVMIVGLLAERDEMGETLASLVMAQRAMSVMMGARINVVPDFDARCQDLQRQLDDQSDKLTEMTLTKAAAQEGLEVAQDQVAQLYEEKRVMDARFQTMADAYNRLLKERASEDITSAAMDRHWKEKNESVRDTKGLKEGFEERVKAYKAAAASAASKCSSSEYELTKEREAHLRTARDLRVCQSEARKQERETNHRVSDLLSELSERDTTIEDLEERIRVLEADAVEQRVVLGKEYVSRQQVEEMQTLFEASVEGLSNRLRDMEKREAEKHRQVKNGSARDLRGIRASGTRRSQAGTATYC
eukprot:g3705.t1